ncbi:glycosyltransferase family 2 protein [Candidatus Enterococcus willemsii]|uniref:Glycosyltransferase 2-like domain-containing protein n=1 Tax=Candidatus Enterococcus willemsii TaxID=1857215 RepID=A0ABQ6Z0Q2_9ENTE|nr:glycosyltransferase family 2 protein [Enterococcus sp. CU12B]KAF1304289.1 hypothetical protein BAU17_12810 [Enterococcus sp. CU12B]
MSINKLSQFSLYVIQKKVTEKPEISIIIPTYNRETIVQECLDKLKYTTYNKNLIEVILVDDCSTDNTYELLNQYTMVFPNIKILKRKENSGGASAPRNDGLHFASGKWVLFLDSDDYLTEYALADAMNIVETDSKIDMVCMPYYRGATSKRAISKSAFHYTETVTGLQFTETKLYNSLNSVGKLFKRELIEKYALDFPLGIRVREDNWFMMKIYSVSNNIAILGNQKDYYYTRDKDEVSLSQQGTPPRDAVKIFLSVFDFIQSLEENRQKKQDLLAIYLNRYTDMIKRGKYAPVRFFEHTKKTLPLIHDNQFADENTKEFIQDLISGKYTVLEKN